ncbi:MAG TPA: MFS transporter [Burkholderiaceae bacterium]|jgi:maltose/moltooligosaccharide transporter
MHSSKPRLSLWHILNMNLGFFGIQFSFGLQQSNMSPIYKYLGADEGSLPLLWLAGPITGLIVQPIIGAMSDRTVTRWGRRTPYFLVGALLCSLGLIAMPLSPTLWFAASLLWILDTANNVAMEPYRAYVSDRLDRSQHELGYLTQSAFTGLAQTLAYLAPSVLVWLGMDRNAVNGHNIPQITIAAFMIGALFSFTTVWWSVRSTPELALTPEAIAHMRAKPVGLRATAGEILDAFRHMPLVMRRLWWMKLFQWYGMLSYWIYIVPSLARTIFETSDVTAPGFREAGLLNGQIGGFYNFIAFLSAFALVPLARRWNARNVHAVCLALAGLAMWAIPSIRQTAWLFVPMVGIGVAWASMMGNPYILLAGAIPPERAGIYMGIFNMFIVIPMIIEMLTVPLYFHSLLGGDPSKVIRLAGVCLVIAAIATCFISTAKQTSSIPAPADA